MNGRIRKWATLTAVLVVTVVLLWLAQPLAQVPQRAVGRSASDLTRPVMGTESGYAISPVAPGDFRDLVSAKRSPVDLKLSCPAVDEAPVIDGVADEAAWARAKKITTLDFSSQRTVTICTVHTSETIFFLVTFPDVSPSTTHKSFGWDQQAGIYKPSNDREDMFVFKWSMQGLGTDLSLRGLRPHRADVWFWKACRTNPVGYADDKWQSYSPRKEGDDSKEVMLSSGPGSMYLLRSGDSGQSAYKEKIAIDYQGSFAPRFANRQPSGSRADVSARGCWRQGTWTVEFARKLDTGHDDDVIFTVGGKYSFIVSCYEISGDIVHAEWSQPLYRTGDGFDRIVLEITR